MFSLFVYASNHYFRQASFLLLSCLNFSIVLESWIDQFVLIPQQVLYWLSGLPQTSFEQTLFIKRKAKCICIHVYNICIDKAYNNWYNITELNVIWDEKIRLYIVFRILSVQSFRIYLEHFSQKVLVWLSIICII